MPRPRTIDDDAVLDAADRIVERGGPAAVTFASVAAEVGLAPATLVQRFGTKRGLLLATTIRGWQSIVDTLSREWDARESPLPTRFATPEETTRHGASDCRAGVQADRAARESARAFVGVDHQLGERRRGHELQEGRRTNRAHARGPIPRARARAVAHGGRVGGQRIPNPQHGQNPA